MKKITTILGLLFLSMTILSSCEGEKSKNKKDNKYEKEIKDPCDILDYSIEIFEYLEALSEEYDDIDDLEDDKKDKKKVNAYFEDLENAWKYAFKEFEAEEMMEIWESECRNDDNMLEAMDEIEDFYEEKSEDFIDFIREEFDNMEKEYDKAEETEEAATAEEAVAVDDYKSYDYAEEKELKFMDDFMRECTSNNDYTENEMYDYCDCALEELMYEYTIDQMDYLDNDEAIDFIKYNTDCLELMEQDAYYK
jgi:hypothetical protein